MISCFPVPYENELWYSVLVRYHNQSGNFTLTKTKEQLFKNKTEKFNSLSPLNQIYRILNMLPTDFLDYNEIIEKNTTFNFERRFYTLESDEKLINNIKNNKDMLDRKRSSLKLTSLKYCPKCAKEEQEKEHENYWHTDHQIPIMYICHKHRCRLLEFNAGWDPKTTLIAPENLNLCETYDCTDIEIKLSDMAYDLWKAPKENKPKINKTFLVTALNHGYRAKATSQGQLNIVKLSKDMETYFGKDLFDKYLAHNIKQEKRLNDIDLYKYMITKNHCVRDHYNAIQVCMWAVFFDLASSDIFDDTRIKDITIEKFEYFKNMNYRQKDIAEALGVKLRSVDNIAEHYGIKKFWKQCVEYDYKYTRIKLDINKYDILQAIAKEKNISYEKLINEIITKYIKETPFLLKAEIKKTDNST